MGHLQGKTAIVTGGASGIGKAIAERLVADGASVCITDVECDLGRATASEGRFTFIEQDVRSEARWGEVVQEVEARLGRLQILVNNAGIVGPAEASGPENTSLADWREVFAVNVEGVFLGCRAAIPAMRRAGGGSIVNLSSIAGLQATPYATAYGASKATVRQLTKSIAQYCAEQKLSIRCNSVHPGVVRTALWDRYAQVQASARGISLEAVIAETRESIPLGDFVLPGDIAAVVSFLASGDARQITGAEILVDGGAVNCDTYRAGSNFGDSKCFVEEGSGKS